MKAAMLFEIASPYTKQELYDLWRNFRTNPNADKMLSDFMESDTTCAMQLTDEFERKFQHDHCYKREGKDRNTL
ncbi:hypothetical protein [uncultured Intestinimonas sp.]|uniref:hypothetical protein n=1 Tax=uncultured Intestinimonas sp. TaxID=1689265 RepID=UPI0029435873|nr:hypothetical protein [uncultured Intestinimonas sp.]